METGGSTVIPVSQQNKRNANEHSGYYTRRIRVEYHKRATAEHEELYRRYNLYSLRFRAAKLFILFLSEIRLLARVIARKDETVSS